MKHVIWDFADIIVTIIIICWALPIMLSSVNLVTDGPLNGFDSVQEKTLIQTRAELYGTKANYFSKQAIPGIFIVNQSKEGKVTIQVEYGGTTQTIEGNSIQKAQEIIASSWFKALPSGEIFAIKDMTDGAGRRVGTVFYERRDS